MTRDHNFTLRVNRVERLLIATIAARLDRTESDTMRLLVREKAHELGVTMSEAQNSGAALSGLRNERSSRAARVTKP